MHRSSVDQLVLFISLFHLTHMQQIHLHPQSSPFAVHSWSRWRLRENNEKNTVQMIICMIDRAKYSSKSSFNSLFACYLCFLCTSPWNAVPDAAAAATTHKHRWQFAKCLVQKNSQQLLRIKFIKKNTHDPLREWKSFGEMQERERKDQLELTGETSGGRLFFCF